MFFLLTEPIISPETQETVAPAGAVLTAQQFELLASLIGIDYITCHACATMSAVDALSKRALGIE